MRMDFTWGARLEADAFDRSYPGELLLSEELFFYCELDNMRVILTDQRIEVSVGDQTVQIDDDHIATHLIWPRRMISAVVAKVPKYGDSPLTLILRIGSDQEVVVQMPYDLTYEEAMEIARKAGT